MFSITSLMVSVFSFLVAFLYSRMSEKLDSLAHELYMLDARLEHYRDSVNNTHTKPRRKRSSPVQTSSTDVTSASVSSDTTV
jgi:hypothetical protein